jgi:hypothetical protein
MPRFYFNMINGRNVADCRGLELSNADEARRHSRLVASELARNGEGEVEIEISVTDALENPISRVIGVG